MQFAIDEFLRNRLRALLREIAGEAAVPSFFVRYSDPKAHLRLRLKFGEQSPRRDLQRALHQMHCDGVIESWAIASYAPEYERYGGIAIQRCTQDQVVHQLDAASSTLVCASSCARCDSWISQTISASAMRSVSIQTGLPAI